MMKMYGWKVTEDSEPGKGVKFTITIPSELSDVHPSILFVAPKI
jgi:signal transduction histidine kinase